LDAPGEMRVQGGSADGLDQPGILLGETLLDLVEDALLVGRQWHGLPAPASVAVHTIIGTTSASGRGLRRRPASPGLAVSDRGRVRAGPQARPIPARTADRSDPPRVRRRPTARSAAARAAPAPPAPGRSRPRRAIGRAGGPPGGRRTAPRPPRRGPARRRSA